MTVTKAAGSASCNRAVFKRFILTQIQQRKTKGEKQQKTTGHAHTMLPFALRLNLSCACKPEPEIMQDATAMTQMPARYLTISRYYNAFNVTDVIRIRQAACKKRIALRPWIVVGSQRRVLKSMSWRPHRESGGGI